MRTGTVKYLQKLGWEVTVVMPNYATNELKVKDNIWQIPFNKSLKWCYRLERIGFYEDYLDPWVRDTYDYLIDKVNEADILFATSGGDLGTIKLASLISEKIGCKFVANFRDPISFTTVNGIRFYNNLHVRRDRYEKKYLQNSDLIITSSTANQKSLEKKYPNVKAKISNNYFGYLEKINLSSFEKSVSPKIRIAYAGSMGASQSPEILFHILKNRLDNHEFELYFIGNRNSYKPLMAIEHENVNFIDFLPHEEFLKFMAENIDIGFVSLTEDYFGACVPSKIFEYINLEIPIFAALPDGDAIDIINENNYGIACIYNDEVSLKKAIEKLNKPEYLESMTRSIIKDKENWSMEVRVLEVQSLLLELDGSRNNE